MEGRGRRIAASLRELGRIFLCSKMSFVKPDTPACKFEASQSFMLSTKLFRPTEKTGLKTKQRKNNEFNQGLLRRFHHGGH